MKKEFNLEIYKKFLDEVDVLLDRATFLLDRILANCMLDTEEYEEIDKLQNDIDDYFLRKEYEKVQD